MRRLAGERLADMKRHMWHGVGQIEKKRLIVMPIDK